jgi:NAD dependent epimerase/dehydratase family enzyme
MGGLLLEGQRAVPSRLLEAGFPFRHATLDAALTEIIG